jgi:ADP-ribosylglycohydrolase
MTKEVAVTKTSSRTTEGTSPDFRPENFLGDDYGVMPAFNFLSPRDILVQELVQRDESGYDVAAVREEVSRALAEAKTGDGAPSEERVSSLLDKLAAAQLRRGWGYSEPTGLDEVQRQLPQAPTNTAVVEKTNFEERVLGAWLGRCAGCCLGKPVEGAMDRANLRSYLEVAGAFPLTDYVPALDPMPEGFRLRSCWDESTRGRIQEAPRDDDTDYTILGLHMLETYGRRLSSDEIAREWLDHLPFTQTYTAERVAYRNLVNGMSPPAAADYRNPYREWIGAQIRADVYGYVHPGNPRVAAQFAWRDAVVSHTANGVYGAMWAAALIAASFTTSSAKEALMESLNHIPHGSRLRDAVSEVLDWHSRRWSWDQAMDAIEAKFGHYSWLHVINNTAVIAAALLWGDGHFGRTVGLAVESGLDTDCVGATAGSVFGALHGPTAIPTHWTAPFHDRIRTSVGGFDNVAISDLARRTVAVADQLADPS